MAMMFVVGQWSFYAMRVLLGIAEAGFFPGMVLYLTYWVPAAERAQDGSALHDGGARGGADRLRRCRRRCSALDGALGLAGWQWLFLVEGFPAVVLGVDRLVVPDRSTGAGRLAANGGAGVAERRHGARAGRARRAVTRGRT